MKYLFMNNKPNPIQLPGKDGKMVYFGKMQKKVLDEFFKRYSPKYLNVIKVVSDDAIVEVSRPAKVNSPKVEKPKAFKQPDQVDISKKIHEKRLINRQKRLKETAVRNNVVKRGNKNIVGRPKAVGRNEATKFSVARIKENVVPISNDIGIGIMSFNRLDSLMCLIESIRSHTDLKKTTVFVSDESTDTKVWDWLKNQKDIVAFHSPRKGIATNSNRLLRCLKRFKFKLLLNDDVEILKDGWDSFYFDNMKNGIKHFCYYQEGVYGAVRPVAQNGVLKISEKPHGAVMAIHDDAFKEVGYFDEGFGVYGFEHVDYSDRINKHVHGNNFFFDASGSDKYFKIYDDKSSDPDKHQNYKKAKSYYSKVKTDNKRKWISPTESSKVDGITVVIPFRDIGRAKCVEAVANNIKSQRYPEVEIIMVEQDKTKKMFDIPCVEYRLVENNSHFCKSIAFNRGVFDASFEKVVLHDADMLVRSDYLDMVSKHLNVYESVHIGKTVCYMDEGSTSRIIESGEINEGTISSDRVVNYYEGGSLAITRSAYHKIGGFCEDFVGYGCEDTEFYYRMVKGSNSFTNRYIDLFHLWHGRTSGWEECHNRNKAIQDKMFGQDINNLMNGLRKHLDRKYGKWN